jgi:hypothetical protein
MKVNFYIEPYNGTWSYNEVFYRFYNHCVQHIKGITFELRNSIDYRLPLYSGANCKYGPHFLIIENDQTKKYIVVSYWDKLADILLHHKVTFWDLENCVEIITSSGVHSDDIYYQPTDFTYTPFSYPVSRVELEQQIELEYASNVVKHIPDKLHFRGYLYSFRKYLESDTRFNVVDKQQNFLYPSEFISNLNLEKISLSLNGAGEICHRDIEILGLGNALFRQQLVVNFHNPLIPNYHYISVNVDDLDITRGIDNYWKELSDRYIDTFITAKKDNDFINFIAENGRRWYIENGTIDANVRILADLINLEKLK